MYSYLLDEYVEVNIMTCDPEQIKKYIAQHDTIVGFNSEEFDIPIMYNNDLMPEKKRFLQVDCLVILGSSTYQRHDGLPFKNRGVLMGYKFKRNSLKAIAETMQLETQKGDIDYQIFFNDVWSKEETRDIKKYLRSDVEATRQMFDKLWDFWMPFTTFISDDNIKKLSWIRASIASLTYQAACKTLGVEETYGDRTDHGKEAMGGRVIEPKYEEARKVWYVDFASLYPHIFAQFNLFSEVDPMFNGWHGNDLFKVRGYYDIRKQHKLSQDVVEKLKTRIHLKKEDPGNPMIYALKIFLNSLYGAVRSEIFEQIHTENAGWDCCWLGQQIQEYTEKRMKDFGFETIAGDTDSIFVVGEEVVTEEYIKQCLKTVVDEIKANVPFPCETFNIDIEDYLHYVMWPFSLEPVKDENGENKKNEKGRLIKEMRGKKKNYIYIYEKDGSMNIKIAGMPIIKDNATKIGPKILNETLKPLMLERMSAKFTKVEMDTIVKEWLSKPDALKDLAREFKVKPALSYKKESQIQAQISVGYFNGQAGVINLIKNKKVGRAGKTAKYCTYEEAVENKLEIKDLDLTKLRNELQGFVENE